MGTVWQAVVVIDGTDRSSLLTGRISVSGEESAARIAEFSIKTPSGSVSAGDWLGVSVTINYKTMNSGGTVLSNDRIFTGIVDRAIFDPRTAQTRFECTDNLQEDIETKTQAQVEALVPAGRWAQAVFGDYQDGWQHLENLLQTTPHAYDYDVTGSGVLTALAAKGTPDFTFDETQIFEGSMEYALAPRRDIYNKTTLSYEYRFRRLKHREHDFSWSFASTVAAWSFCAYLGNSHETPTREMILSAAESAGWALQAPPLFVRFPPSGSYCSPPYYYTISDALRDQLVVGASWTAVKRWTQEATETYTLTVQCPQSVTWIGEVALEDYASNQTQTEVDGWAEGIDTPTGTGVRTDALGDYVIDQVDRTVSDNDIETLIARARTEMLAAHRGNWLQGRVELQPTLERSDTVKLDYGWIVGQGKVSMLTHEMNIDSGRASTMVRIGISLNGGAAAGGDVTIAAPTAPSTDPTSTAPSSSTLLATHLGGHTGAAIYDETWTGFTGDYASPLFGAEQYPRRFRVDTPEINQDAIDAGSGEQTATYEFDIPNETLTITVP